LSHEIGRDGRRDAIEHPRLGGRPSCVGLAEDADPPQLLPVDRDGRVQTGRSGVAPALAESTARDQRPARIIIDRGHGDACGIVLGDARHRPCDRPAGGSID
jgi:hypothetical protein